MTAMYKTRRSIWLGGAMLLATCSSRAPEAGRDAGGTAAYPDARTATGGRTGTGGTMWLGPDAPVAGAAGGVGGTGGVDGASAGEAGPGTLACREEGGACETATDCCAGSTCVDTSTDPGGYRCKRNCTAHAQCQTGCCAPLVGSGTSVCLDGAYCPSIFCHKEEQACQDNYTCCDGMACAVFDAQTSACKRICAQNADCQTGCCVLLEKAGVSICLDAIYCRSAVCRPAEQACGEDAACCDGLLCVGFATNPVTTACKPTCTKNQDCPTGCCALLGSGTLRACLDRSYCSSVR
jgi:hypothetical protein